MCPDCAVFRGALEKIRREASVADCAFHAFGRIEEWADAALASSLGAAWVAWARKANSLLSDVVRCEEQHMIAVADDDEWGRIIEAARALLARAPDGIKG